MISPDEYPRGFTPCYCIFSFVQLPGNDLPRPGSRLMIEYLTKDVNAKKTVQKVKFATFSKILKPEQNSEADPLKAGWGILGFKENSESSASGDPQKEPTLIVTVGKMQRKYSNIVITPLSSKVSSNEEKW